jgi:putative ABC transport system permease protein
VLVGAVIASPVVFVIGGHWLQNFTDHIELGPRILFITTATVFAFVLVAVGRHALKAVLADPVDALRHE